MHGFRELDLINDQYKRLFENHKQIVQVNFKKTMGIDAYIDNYVIIDDYAIPKNDPILIKEFQKLKERYDALILKHPTYLSTIEVIYGVKPIIPAKVGTIWYDAASKQMSVYNGTAWNVMA